MQAQNQFNQAEAVAQTEIQTAVTTLQDQLSTAQEAEVTAQNKLAFDQASWTDAISQAENQVSTASALAQELDAANQGKLVLLRSQEQQAVQTANATLATAKAQYAQALRTAEQAVAVAKANDISAVQRMQAGLIKAESALSASRGALSALNAPPQSVVVAEAKTAIAAAQSKVQLLLHPYNSGTLQSLRGAVAVAQGKLTLAQEALTNTVIRAPFNGVVTAVNSVQGDSVAAQKTVISMVGNRLEIQANMSQQDINQVRAGDSVQFTLPFDANQSFPGTVVSVSPTANPQTLAFTVSVIPRRKITGLAAGETAYMQVITSSDTHAVLIPTAAIVTQSGTPQVFEAQNGRALLKDVVTGATQGSWTQISSGVSAGDKVVTLGQTFLAPGDRVTVANAISRLTSAAASKRRHRKTGSSPGASSGNQGVTGSSTKNTVDTSSGASTTQNSGRALTAASTGTASHQGSSSHKVKGKHGHKHGKGAHKKKRGAHKHHKGVRKHKKGARKRKLAQQAPASSKASTATSGASGGSAT